MTVLTRYGTKPPLIFLSLFPFHDVGSQLPVNVVETSERELPIRTNDTHSNGDYYT